VILATVLGLLATACGGETLTVGGDFFPTPEPAPTVAGRSIEAVEPEFNAEIVFIGVPVDETIDIRALPGVNQPPAGQVPPGTRVEKMTEEFETEDGLLWWQVRAGDVQGWIQPNVAYMGPDEDITELVAPRIDSSVIYAEAEEAALVVAEAVALDQGPSDIMIVGRRDIEGQNSTTITVDILQPGDDSVIGSRLRIASSITSGHQPIKVLKSTLCARGVDGSGLCL